MQTVEEFAASINRTTAMVRAWIYRYGLPVVKIGRINYIRQEDYEAWIAARVEVKQPARKTIVINMPESRKKVNPHLATVFTPL